MHGCRERRGWLVPGLCVALAAVIGGGVAVRTTAAPAGISAPGGFMVSPTRIVFENGRRNAQVTIVNTREKGGTYRISLVRMRMTEDGAIQDVAAPLEGEQFADTLVRFSPRQADLEPRVPLIVRLQLRVPADLPAGEYRSHLVVRAVPPPPPADSNRLSSDQGMGIQITPVYGVAIPVIVRQGATRATLALTGLELRAPGNGGEPYRLALVLKRGGDRSVYGNLTVTYLESAKRSRVVGRANGLAVYTPNPIRHFELPLDLPDVPARDGGRLAVTFAEPGAEHAPLATAWLPLR